MRSNDWRIRSKASLFANRILFVPKPSKVSSCRQTLADHRGPALRKVGGTTCNRAGRPTVLLMVMTFERVDRGGRKWQLDSHQNTRPSSLSSVTNRLIWD